MGFTILRFSKLKTLGNLGGSALHAFRERPTPNADAERSANNTATGEQNAAAVVKAAQNRLADLPKYRKNAVLAVEYLMTASPEWFEKGGDTAGYFQACEDWLRERHGPENVLAVVRHEDETTPHLCAYVVPVDPGGNLNASHFFDGRAKLAAMQTDFHLQAGQRFGLERGIEGSKAEHIPVKTWYARMADAELTGDVSASISITPDDLKRRKIEKAGFFGRDQENVEEVADRLTETVQARVHELVKPLTAATLQYGMSKVENDRRERALRELRQSATMARNIPLDLVLEHLGCERDRSDVKRNWRTPAGRMTVDGSKFYAHDAGKGGGGAIDLVMLLNETDYRGAVNWLAREFGTGKAIEQVQYDAKKQAEQAAAEPEKPFAPPIAVADNWPHVRKYLTEKRRIAGHIVDTLHDGGYLYADKYRNAVFKLGNECAELRGTGPAPFHGIRGEKTPQLYTKGNEKKIAFVESSIDALSLYELGYPGAIVSVFGNAKNKAKEEAQKWRSRGYTVVAAFDNDAAGNAQAAQLDADERLTPEHGKDWNDDLRRRKETPEEKQVREANEREETKRRHLEEQRRRIDAARDREHDGPEL